MPVWHDATRKWVKEGRLRLLGVVQEQHADRCRLFAQWKRFGWPILHDPINVLGLRAVPILVAIDEHGIVRAVRPRLGTFQADFLDRKFTTGAPPPAGAAAPPSLAALKRRAETARTADAWRALGDGHVLWGGPKRINNALSAYTRALKLRPKHGRTLFSLGVCLRMRAESAHHQPGDFQAAVVSWTQALSTDPNQYIWRRRIQQYGPRLDKPYPFYDWVSVAQKEIAARGDTPVPLAVPPFGAEVAHPARRFVASDEQVASPDPKGEIRRDARGLIQVEAALVPPKVRPGRSARVHVIFRPNAKHEVHWNNEAGALRLWVDAPEGWQISRRLLTAPRGKRPETNEIRRLDFEVRAPASASGRVRMKAYALYYVCEGVGGRCLFLRRDVGIDIEVSKGSPKAP